MMQLNATPLTALAEKKILILGLGREGRSSYQFLRAHGPSDISLALADSQPLEKLTSFWQTEIANHHLEFYHLVDGLANNLTEHSAEKMPWESIDCIVISPGISDRVLYQNYGAPDTTAITSNTQLFFSLTENIPTSELITIGVTGTKGKSTTTAGIYHVLAAAGAPCVLGGNIGIPPLDVLSQLLALDTPTKIRTKTRYAVLELSSHQLSRVHHSPQVAVVQAITPEHLDYYLDFVDYFEAKTAITRYQKSNDVVFFNADSDTARQIAQLSPGLQRGFSLENTPLTSAEIKIPGKHNVLNLTPAVLVAEYLGFDPEQAANNLYSFTGLPHRLQLVTTPNGDNTEQNSEQNTVRKTIRYYDDSLSTTPEAAMAAVLSFDSPVVLIAGGYDRGLEYQELGAFLADAGLQGKLRGLIYFPPSGERIVEAVRAAESKSNLPMIKVETMAEAVAEANKLAQPGDVVLLSPASASFGRFKDYADRGQQFVAAVNSTHSNNGE